MYTIRHRANARIFAGSIVVFLIFAYIIYPGQTIVFAARDHGQERDNEVGHDASNLLKDNDLIRTRMPSSLNNAQSLITTGTLTDPTDGASSTHANNATAGSI